jgi:hypothetical protein
MFRKLAVALVATAALTAATFAPTGTSAWDGDWHGGGPGALGNWGWHRGGPGGGYGYRGFGFGGFDYGSWSYRGVNFMGWGYRRSRILPPRPSF